MIKAYLKIFWICAQVYKAVCKKLQFFFQPYKLHKIEILDKIEKLVCKIYSNF